MCVCVCEGGCWPQGSYTSPCLAWGLGRTEAGLGQALTKEITGVPEALDKEGGAGVEGMWMGTTNSAWGRAGHDFALGEGAVELGLEE